MSKAMSTNQFTDYFKSLNDLPSVFIQANEANDIYLNGELHGMLYELNAELMSAEVFKACI